ncbi:MAG: hypothetical protein QOJ32_152 [Frankiaceae bacterium]|jgi:uncharacterized RDD family membrane protein YckC|nr:hypothetical protein [Frankiaceae bacterium]
MTSAHASDGWAGGRPPAPRALPEAFLPYRGQPAGVISRSLAGGVDLALVVTVGVSMYLGYSGLRFLWNPRDFHFGSLHWLVAVVVEGTLLAVYLTACWATSGRTYGDRVLALRVTDANGDRLHVVHALARAVLCVVIPLGLFLSALTATKRSLSDVLLRTTVRYDWER